MSDKPSFTSQISQNQFPSFPQLANWQPDASLVRGRFLPSDLSPAANVNAQRGHHPQIVKHRSIVRPQEMQTIKALPLEREPLKSLPVAQLDGDSWILCVLEDLIAFSQGNSLPESEASISAAYIKVAQELGEKTHRELS